MAPITLPAAGSTTFPRQISDSIFEDVSRGSVVQQLARRVNLPESGTMIPITTEKPKAGWVTEGQRKPTTNAAQSFVNMDRKKLSAIIVFSMEYVRSDPSRLYANIRPQLQEAFSTAFDLAAIHGVSHDGTAGPFPTSLDQTTKAVELGTTAQANGGTYGDIVAGLKLLTDDRKRLNGFAVDPMAEPVLLASVDLNGRPIWVDAPVTDTVSNRLIGRPAGISEGVGGEVNGTATDLRMIGGDWSKVAYGVGTNISYTVSREATVTIDGTLTSLWENNLVAMLAEAEYGFVVGDPDAFVRYTDAVGTAPAA